MINKILIMCCLCLQFKYHDTFNTLTMKRSIQIFTLLFITFFFLTAIVSANSLYLNTLEYHYSKDDMKKDKKRKNDIKTNMSDREKPPVLDDNSVSIANDQAYNYMSAPKLEDCTKSDFDRE